MQTFIVVLLASCAGLVTANPQFWRSADNASKQSDVAFASIFKSEDPNMLEVENVDMNEGAPALALVDRPEVSNFHVEPTIFGKSKPSPRFARHSKEVSFDLFPTAEDLDNAIDTEEDNDEHIPSPSDIPGYSYADTLEKMEAMGIDTRSVAPDLLEQALLLVPELVRRNGYPCDVHTVQTSDGYILEMHRIPYSPQNRHLRNRTPVFVMHGLLDSSSTWVIMGPNNGLAYLLADLGYDVWLGNARGNRYSRKHESLNPDGRRRERRRFWDFSWHAIGTTDLPTMIDYVLANTNHKRLHYIGHSQGTTSFFVMASERPEYNEKIIAMQALAPVAFMSNLRSPLLRLASTMLNTLDATTSALGVYEFMPNSDLLGRAAQAVCHDYSFVQGVCSNILFLLAGYSPDQLNATMIPVIAGHTPAGASVDQLVHYGQGIRSGRFRQFDHGTVSNLLNHGSIRPPAYQLRNVRTPVALHYSVNDWMAAVEDVHELASGLPNVIGMFLVPDQQFNHLDFVWGIDVEKLLYSRMFKIMQLAELFS